VALNPLALFDLATLKTWCKVTTQDPPTAADTDVLTLLEVIGNGASEYCEARIGQRFKKRTSTVTRDGDGRSKLLRLPRPIVSVASLTIDDQVIGASEYALDRQNGKITLRARAFSVGLQNVSVTLDAGYDFAVAADAAQVADVVAAALDLAKSHYDEWTTGAIAASSISIGPASVMIRPGLNPRIEKFLDGKKDVRG